MPIRDYALIGDMRSAALVSREGSIDWLCWPNFASPALFLRLLDADRGGACWLELDDGITKVQRRYLPGTNIFETVFETAQGTLRVTDFMPVRPAIPGPEGPDSIAEGRILRLFRCDRGRVAFSVVVRPTFDYARTSCAPEARGRAGVAVFEAGLARMRVEASRPVALGPDRVSARFVLGAGDNAYIGLTRDAGAHPIPALDVEAVHDKLTETHAYWERWSARCTYDGTYRDSVLRRILCLKLLTLAPTGAIIAAPTAGLPAEIGGIRNWDYRFAWMRDARFAVTAFLNLGYVREAAEFLRFLRDVDKFGGRDTSVLYPIDGGATAEETLDHLEGYGGSRPVTIGNAASRQLQLDDMGEFLLALHAYLLKVGVPPPDPGGLEFPALVRRLAEVVILRKRGSFYRYGNSHIALGRGSFGSLGPFSIPEPAYHVPGSRGCFTAGM